jgi:undecaprenyl-diphosphatase
MPSRFVRRALVRGALGAVLGGALTRGRRSTGALGGFAAGAAIERPLVGAPFAIAALVAGRDEPGALAIGAAAAAATTRVWPTAPRTVDELRRHATKRHIDPNPDGEGIAVVVNAGAGSAESDETAAQLRERLPRARVFEVGEDDDVGEVLARAVEHATVAFGAAGGDGTLSAASALALDHDVAFLALPAGTLNHFARDVGLLSVDDALDALAAGEVIEIDLAEVGDRTFLNTCSFGAYTDLVDARERLEDRIGKWPAVAVSLVGVLRRAEPVQLEVDGRDRSLWLGFIGNSRYLPAGFAPTWRESIDDGLLDIRLVDADQPWARLRLLVSVLLGRLGRSTVYEQRAAETLDLASGEGSIRLALDGEVCEVDARVRVAKRSARLAVFAPHR